MAVVSLFKSACKLLPQSLFLSQKRGTMGERGAVGGRQHGREGSDGGEARDWVREMGEWITTGGGERRRLEKGSLR